MPQTQPLLRSPRSYNSTEFQHEENENNNFIVDVDREIMNRIKENKDIADWSVGGVDEIKDRSIKYK